MEVGMRRLERRIFLFLVFGVDIVIFGRILVRSVSGV